MRKGGNQNYAIKRNDLLFPELSFEIVGALFDVYKQLGGGHNEKYYQKAVAIGLEDRNIQFEEQRYVPLTFNEQLVGKYFLDFILI
jgi:GxxExxY protein